MKAQNKQDRITIDSDRITLSFGNMEPIVIPRRALRTRLQLVEWIYRLTGWPGMDLQRMRKFIGAVFRHHGWRLPKLDDFPLLTADETNSSSDIKKLSTESTISHRRIGHQRNKLPMWRTKTPIVDPNAAAGTDSK
jgi:hypothetical protein